MLRVYVGIFLAAFSTLLVELVLTRAFDVILYPNMAYMIITCALFSFGIAGVYRTLRPLDEREDPSKLFARYALLFGVTTILLLPALNAEPFNFNLLPHAPVKQSLFFIGMYLILVVPFFFGGLIFTSAFSAYSNRVQPLYFWDLVGASCGALIVVPFIRLIAPAGLLFVAGAASLVASALFSFSRNKTFSALVGVAAVVAVIVPILKAPNYFEFRQHDDKRGVVEAKEKGARERVVWDPISKIEVMNALPNQATHRTARKHIAYDGGNQSSYFFPFDGNFNALRRKIENGTEPVEHDFWTGPVLLSHYLKRDTNQNVLIIGSAGGGQVKAALMFGAKHVDAVELVGAVVKLGKTAYSRYLGGFFLDPRVSMHKGEGRSFLRSTKKKYDIIQMFSIYTSSSIAAGSGAMATAYLQTAEAYEEYFSHLKHDGILQINRYVYPRMITTAALAWKRMGRKNFRAHVVVLDHPLVRIDTQPTLLIKMTPWTREEVAEIRSFSQRLNVVDPMRVVEDPFHPKQSFLSNDFYSGNFPASLSNEIPYRVDPATDDRPFFGFLRKHIRELSPDPTTFVNSAIAGILNEQLEGGIPMDVAHLIVTAVASLFFVGVFLLVPMLFSRAGKAGWGSEIPTLSYFSCLGAGFIILELTFIEIFRKLIGFPLYTYTTVLFVMLLSAGLGSFTSPYLGINAEKRWKWPFVWILAYGALFLIFYPSLFGFFLGWSQIGRILIASIMIFPLGFALGMPFPVGILLLDDKPRGAVAWAWAMNGVFTVVGGLASVLLSLFLGFRITITIALGIYVVAFLSMRQMQRAEVSEVSRSWRTEPAAP